MSRPLSESTAVVTVSYNSSSQLESFLDSVAGAGEDAVPVVIVDNASADLPATEALAASHGARVVRLAENKGYGGAVNAAVASLPSTVDYVLISNPDVSVQPHAIERLVAALDSHPHVGAVGPRVLNEDGSMYPSARAFPSLRNGVGHALLGDVWPQNPWSRSYHADHDGLVQERSVGWLSGSCLLVRRDAFEAIGGFDEGYFMYFEDVDLGYRLDKAGWERLFLPDAVVVHIGGTSTSAESTKMIQVHHDSAYRYLEKKYSAPVLAPVRWTLRAGLSIRAWYLTRHR
jgi:N-acetylglucosaminyl-diphospho-decaprenol L-rhamnosyltransferase